MAEGRMVHLKVTGTQYPPEDTAEKLTGKEREEAAVVTCVHADAEWYRRGDRFYLFYEEQPDECGVPVKTRMKYREGLLELTRRGGAESHMVFEAGKVHSTDYPTPYGNLPLDVVTGRVSLGAEPTESAGPAEFAGCLVTVDYILENGGRQLGVYQLKIEAI